MLNYILFKIFSIVSCNFSTFLAISEFHDKKIVFRSNQFIESFFLFNYIHVLKYWSTRPCYIDQNKW